MYLYSRQLSSFLIYVMPNQMASFCNLCHNCHNLRQCATSPKWKQIWMCTSNTTGHYIVLRIKCMILLRRHKSSQSKENIQRGNIYLSAEIHKTKTLTLRKIFLKPCLYLFNYCLVWFRISGFTKIS